MGRCDPDFRGANYWGRDCPVLLWVTLGVERVKKTCGALVKSFTSAPSISLLRGCELTQLLRLGPIHNHLVD